MSNGKFHVGQLLPDGSIVESIEFEDFGDYTVERMRESTGGGSMQATPKPGTPAANQEQIMQRLRDALVNNATALYEGGPEGKGVNVAAHLRDLTRQVDALIRVTLQKYETTAGT